MMRTDVDEGNTAVVNEENGNDKCRRDRRILNNDPDNGDAGAIWQTMSTINRS
jgi:hypothetical protein